MISRSTKKRSVCRTSSPSSVCVCVCVCVCWGWWRWVGRWGCGGVGGRLFCQGTLDKTKTTHSSGPLPHLVFRNKSSSGCEDPITPPLPLLGVVSVVLLGDGWGMCVLGGGFTPDRQTMPFECKASAAANPPSLLPRRRQPSIILWDFAAIFGRTAKPPKDLH